MQRLPFVLYLVTISIFGRVASVVGTAFCFCVPGASVSALPRGVSSYRAVDLHPLVHPVETCYCHQFFLQFGMELDIFI